MEGIQILQEPGKKIVVTVAGGNPEQGTPHKVVSLPFLSPRNTSQLGSLPEMPASPEIDRAQRAVAPPVRTTKTPPEDPKESTCKNCGALFVKLRSRQCYCSLQCRRKYNQRTVDAAKHSRVNPAEWERYKKDPQREHKKKDDFIVCRECPEKHAALQRHIAAKHDITVPEYLEKWGNPPVIAPSVPDSLRRKHAGKPRRYARGKKYLGDNIQGEKRREGNRNSHTKREVAPVDDATLALGRLGGKSIVEISAEAELTHASILKRLKYLGFPPGRAYLFLHAQPVAKKHFDDLRKDFDVDVKEIIEVVGENPPYEVSKRIARQSGGWRTGSAGKAPRHYYDCLLNHLKRRDPADILLARFANIVLDARKRWTEAFCFDYRGGRKRIRTFRQSEVRDLSGLFRLLRKPLSALRIWLSGQKNPSIKRSDILNWICEQSRLEVAHDGGTAFRRLMFLWPALERLLDRNGLNCLVDQKYKDETVYELLAKDYDATAHAIRNAVSGKLKPSPPETLGQIIRAQLANTRGQTKKSVGERGRHREDVKDRTYFKVGIAVENEIPSGLKQDRHSIVAAPRLICQRARLQFDVVAQYHKRYRKAVTKPV